MKKIKIRFGKLEDCEECVNISKIPELKTPIGNYPSLRWLSEIVKEKQILFVAEIDKKIVGYIMGERISGNWAIAHLMAVVEVYRKKGIGKSLIKSFEEECKKRNFGGIIAYGYKNNPQTIEFLLRNNYNKGSDVVEFNKILKS